MISLKEALRRKNRGNVNDDITDKLIFNFMKTHYMFSLASKNAWGWDRLFKECFEIKDNIINVKGKDGSLIYNNYTKDHNDMVLPEGFKFGEVEGSFSISHVKSLEGCPEYVGGSFRCDLCDITSMKGCPKEIGGSFSIEDCPSLRSLEGCPEKIEYNFYLRDCPNLRSLEGSPKYISRDLSISGCSNLRSLEGGPEKVGNNLSVSARGMHSLKGMPKEVGDRVDLVVDKSIKSLEGCPDSCQVFYVNVREGGPSDLTGMPKEVSGNIELQGYISSLKGMPENFKGVLNLLDATYINSLEFCPKSVKRVYIRYGQTVDLGVVAKSKIKIR